MDLGEEDMVYRIGMIVVKLKLLIPYSSIKRMNESDLFNEGVYSLYRWRIQLNDK